MIAGHMYLFDRLRSLLFGIATRRAVIDYLRAVVLVMFILLVIAWTIDLAQNFAELRRASVDRDVPLVSILFPYLGYRAVDIMTRLLTMACFFGAFFAEISRRLKLETVILTAAAASPLRLMAGALWLALILGILQGGLEARWRPSAVWAQVKLGVGDYAHRYEPRWLSYPSWIVNDDVAIRGIVHRSQNPEIRDVMVFTGIRGLRLKNIYRAGRMIPTSVPFEWRLQDVTSWPAGQLDGVPTEDLTLKIELIPEMLTYFGVLKFNLPSKALYRFQILPDEISGPEVSTAIWRRRTAWILPGAFLILGICLAQRGFEGRQMVIPRLIGLAAFGYIIVVAIKVFWALGESAILPAPVATLASIALALLASMLVSSWRR